MAQKIKRILKELYLALAVLCLVILILNFAFFKAQLQYVFGVGRNYQPPVIIGVPNTLRINALSIAAPIIYVQENSDQVFEDALASGIVHYPGTALPGEYGNAYFFGHSSDFVWAKGNYKTIFAALPKINVNDQILITDQQGKTYFYFVTGTEVVANNSTKVLDQGSRDKKLLTLQTSYPIGTALKRFIVHARMREDINR